MARAVVYSRTYRPAPVTFSVCAPPVPVVVWYTVDQLDPLSDSWIWNAVAYAASQFSTTRLTVAAPPRSTWIHCGSLNCDDQRVPVLPSTAAFAGVPAFSTEDAVTDFPWEIRESAACAEGAARPSVAATRATASVANLVPGPRRRRRGRAFVGMVPPWPGKWGGPAAGQGTASSGSPPDRREGASETGRGRSVKRFIPPPPACQGLTIPAPAGDIRNRFTSPSAWRRHPLRGRLIGSQPCPAALPEPSVFDRPLWTSE